MSMRIVDIIVPDQYEIQCGCGLIFKAPQNMLVIRCDNCNVSLTMQELKHASETGTVETRRDLDSDVWTWMDVQRSEDSTIRAPLTGHTIKRNEPSDT